MLPGLQHHIDDAAVQCIVLPLQSPNLNAYAERWVRSVKDEVLSRLILFGEPSLRHALSQYIIVSYEESGMPVDFLTEAERERWQRLPDTIPQDDLLVFFLLSDDDRRETQRQRAPQNRLGYALQLCILRYLGFVPDDLQAPPHEVVTFVAEQLEMDLNMLTFGLGGACSSPGVLVGPRQSCMSSACRARAGRRLRCARRKQSSATSACVA